jgi:SAM-dependent methyltransferase
MIDDPPSPFLSDWTARLAASVGIGARALDVAMGRGRHARLLARSGFRAYGVDRNLEALREAVAKARAESLAIRAWCADLTVYPLPPAAFDLIVVARYLQRDLFRAIRSATKPGGFVLYETFTVEQRRLGFGPTSGDHLLEPAELVGWFAGFEVLFYEETLAPEAVARLAARRWSSRS